MREQIVRIGTRGSLLAMAQTDMVIAKIKDEHPELAIETVVLRTQGDAILDKPLIEFGGKGVFVTAFEEALLAGNIDLAVHSAKDMPMELTEGLEIAGVLKRADARDVLVTRKDMAYTPQCLKDIVIGTGSLRRQAQLKRLCPGVQCKSIRGNVPTRLEKIRQGECDGVILAAAGLERLGLLEEPDFVYHFFPYEEMVPAGGQGIIAIEGRVGDAVSEMAREISDENAWIELQTERKVLELLGAGCHEAVGILTIAGQEQLEYYMMQEKNGNIIKKCGKVELAKRLDLAEQLAD